MRGKELVVVIDFGSQYTHLIARRVRELGVYSEVLPYHVDIEYLEKLKPRGIILSGGPRSVFEEGAPRVDSRILELNIPVLGICYGHQLLALMLGGEVRKGERGEYGKALLRILKKDIIFRGLDEEEIVWMSHRDLVVKLPSNVEVLASTEVTRIAAFRHKEKPIYGLQFHPEVSHTPRGKLVLRNFLYEICRCKGTWNPVSLIDDIVNDIKEKVKPDEKVLCAVSGGVDSVTTAILVHKAVGDRLIVVFVNHGFLRKNEPEQVLKFLKGMGINVIYVDASER
ncbi:MAG: GMP synthase (glutamine-hydrolyzing), partial [Thermoprotei archaeon]